MSMCRTEWESQKIEDDLLKLERENNELKAQVSVLLETVEGIRGCLAQGEANAIIALEIAERFISEWRRDKCSS